jgi:hypothetical protein
MNELNGEQYNDNYKPSETDTGWIATDGSGNHWLLYVPTQDGRKRIAECNYQYMKIKGVEQWSAVFYPIQESFNFHGPVWENHLENLSGCVEWVNKFQYGGYYL